MSANLLDGATVTRGTKDSDGYWVLSKNDGTDKKDSPMWSIDGQPTLSENQAVHLACSVMPDDDWNSNACFMSVQYLDAAGNQNWVQAEMGAAKAGVWTRLEASVIIPSGMRVSRSLVSNAFNSAAGAKVIGVVVSYGSGIPVAEETFTPFESAGHAQTTYATYSSQKILSDSIAAEVGARAKTDGAVSELSSKLSQTVDGINVSLDRLADTDKQIHSWFDFGSDASGNPKLSMGSSSSPIVGEYSNTGTAYKSRSGATLLALDAANSTTTADHMLAKDIAIGKWQWVPTNSGNNLTLVWKG